MLAVLHCLLLATYVISGPITININTRGANTSLELSGHIEDPLTENDKDTFQITDDNLKLGLEAIMGSKPSAISLGHWQGLYRKNNWSPVMRTLTPIKAIVLKIHKEPVIISKQRFSNTVSKPANFRAEISSGVTDTITSSWSDSRSLSRGAGTSVHIYLSSLSGDFSYTNTWGVDIVKGRTSTVGSSSGVSIDLSPGEEVEAVLSATRGVIDIQVEYVAGLKGDVASKFLNPYRGRFFWRQDVNSVMAAVGMPPRVVSRQNLRIATYSEAKVTLVNVTSMVVMDQRPVFGL